MAEPMTPERRAEIRARARAATPGPWAYELTGDKDNTWNIGLVLGEDDEQPLSGQIELEQGDVIEAICEASLDGTPDDAAFIAHARTDVPDLLGEVDQLTARLGALDAALDRAATIAEADHPDAAERAWEHICAAFDTTGQPEPVPPATDGEQAAGERIPVLVAWGKIIHAADLPEAGQRNPSGEWTAELACGRADNAGKRVRWLSEATTTDLADRSRCWDCWPTRPEGWPATTGGERRG